MAVGLLERLGFPTGQTAKIIDGHHPAQLSTNGNIPNTDMVPLPRAEEGAHEGGRLILGLAYHLGMGGHFDLGDTAEYVLKHAPCRVWLIRGRPPEAGEQRSESEEPVAAMR